LGQHVVYIFILFIITYLLIMCIGPFKLICHWGPIIALLTVKCICLSSLHCLTMWWPPTSGLGGLLNIIVFTAWNGLVLYNFFSAMFIGPGYVPLGWKPENAEDVQYLQFCTLCKGYKAPRAHHCRKCQRCVLKMDHHCPWINNCCGFRNQANFIYFLLFAVCGCIHATIILSCSIYRVIYRSWYFVHNQPPIINLGIYGFILGLFALGLAIGVIIAVGFLFIIQIKCVSTNISGIESWILDKAKRPRPEGEVFVHPYHLGWRRNLRETFCRKEEYDDDEGTVWPVIDGCNQYTLTIEQIQQKNVKKARTREYTIIEDYSGALFPITKGLRVTCTPPLSDEPRIPLKIGDKVLVSRWKRNWLYGEQANPNSRNGTNDDSERVKGWFPRKCAVDIINGSADSHLKITEKKKQEEGLKILDCMVVISLLNSVNQTTFGNQT